MTTRYEAKIDYINEIIEPALGEYAAQHDMDAIADEMLEYRAPQRQDDPRWADANTAGYYVREDADFWTIVANHAIEA